MKEKVYINNGNIMYLYKTMKKYTDVNHPLKISEIIELIEKEYGEHISRRTIRRNFKVLEEKFNIPIERVMNNAYYIDYEDNNFDPSEVRALVDMVNYSRFVDEALSKQLIDKLINLLNENDKKDFIGYDKYMKNVKTTNKQIFFTIKMIAEAILNKKYIQFDYYKYNVKKEFEFRKSFLIFPVTILCDVGQYYLVAANTDKKLFYFRLDRIKNIKIKEGKILNISKKQLDNYIASSVGMYGGELEIVEAIINKNLIDDVIDTFGRDVEISEYNEKQFMMKTKINIEGFKNWSLRHLEDVQITYPLKLKDEIARILEKALNKYK